MKNPLCRVRAERAQKVAGALQRRIAASGQETRQRRERPAAKGRRQRVPPPLLALVEGVLRVAGEALVTAVARERDGHRLARHPRDEVGRQERRVGERLVEEGGDLHQALLDVATDGELAVIGPEQAGDLGGVGRLVVRLRLEADGAGRDGRVAVPRHQADDGARIHPAAQEGPERHVADHADAHGVVEQGVELLDDRVVVAGAGRRERDVPPAFRRDGAVRVDAHPVPGGELLDVLEDALGVGHVLVGEEVPDGVRTQPALDARDPRAKP